MLQKISEGGVFNKNSDYKRLSGRTPTWKTIGIITARKSREPGLFVGPIVRKTSPIRVKGKNSRNLAVRPEQLSLFLF